LKSSFGYILPLKKTISCSIAYGQKKHLLHSWRVIIIDEWLKILIHVWKVLSSSHKPGANYHGWDLSRSCLILQANGELLLKIGYECFVSWQIQFITIIIMISDAYKTHVFEEVSWMSWLHRWSTIIADLYSGDFQFNLIWSPATCIDNFFRFLQCLL
jgi:hypothetical protein